MSEAKIIDGKALAQEIRGKLAEEIACHNHTPKLAVILVGHNEASQTYVRNKKKAAQDMGIDCQVYDFEENVEPDEVMSLIAKLNDDEEINGILVQLPLPNKFDVAKVMDNIASSKDVDGFSSYNIGLLSKGLHRGFSPATPKGIRELLYKVNEMQGLDKTNLTGKHVVIIGRSQIVGRPLAMELLNQNCTVTVTHSQTINLPEITKQADILIVACGCPKMVKADWVKDGATVIDVGINRIEGKLCGDVDFDEVKLKAAFITPVPGGVGPMTIAMLLANTYQAFLSQRSLKK